MGQLFKRKNLFVALLIYNLTFNIQHSLSSQITNRILFIFDDSYSMYAPWNSNVKIEVAKKVMGDFLDSLRNISDLELALRCYGHTTFFKPERNCKDSKLEVAFADKAGGGIISPYLEGGHLKGLLDFRDRNMESVQSRIGLLALTLAVAFLAEVFLVPATVKSVRRFLILDMKRADR